MNYRMCVPCLLGLEGPIADELKRLDTKDVAAENGRVYFSGDDSVLARANICLRIGERVLIELGRFDALSFDEKNQAYVYMYNAEQELERRDITVGVSNGNYVEIRGGVEENETVYAESKEKNTKTDNDFSNLLNVLLL